MGARAVRVDLLSDAESIRAQAPHWSRLCAELVADSMFMSWAWLETLLEHDEGSFRMLVFRVEDDSPVALIPFVERDRPGLLGRPEFAMGGSHFGWPNHLDVACEVGLERVVAEALVDWLSSATWGAASFQRFRSGSPVVSQLADLAGGRFHLCRQAPSDSPSFELSESLDEFYAGLTKSFRKKLRYKVRRLRREYSVEFGFAESASEVTEAFDRLVELHRARLHDRGGLSHFADHPENLAFHRTFCQRAAAQGCLRLGRLLIDGMVAAVSYDVRAGGSLFMYNVGFDPQLERYSPGNVLTVLAIERYIEEGVGECNLMVGAEPYKFAWANQVRRDQNLILFPRGLLGGVNRQIHLARERRGERLRIEDRQRRKADSPLKSFTRTDDPPIATYPEGRPLVGA